MRFISLLPVPAPPHRTVLTRLSLLLSVHALLFLILPLLPLPGCGRARSSSDDAGGQKTNVQVVGRIGDQPGFFSKPRAVASLADGGFLVVDRTGRVQRFDADGAYRLHWRLPAYDNGTPTGFSVDPRDDSLWIADTHYQRILHYSNDGHLFGQFGQAGTEPGKMIFPTDCAIDPDDFTLWVSEYGNRNRIMHFATDGAFLGEWGEVAKTKADLLRPQSLRVVPGGDLLVCDAGHHRIWRFRRGPGAPEPIGAWGQAGTAPGQLKYPYSLDVASDKTVYVVEFGNSRVSHFTVDGRFLGVWGGPGHGPEEMYTPWGLSVDQRRNRLLIADSNNNRVLLVSPLPE